MHFNRRKIIEINHRIKKTLQYEAKMKLKKKNKVESFTLAKNA